ncbi:aminotransferase class I/II-fold pyridoxal phosphate-dependent enzyme [Limnobacter litoralis]|nr:8-amino-7-oxononanoate synthase [Limnobacter litoralis]
MNLTESALASLEKRRADLLLRTLPDYASAAGNLVDFSSNDYLSLSRNPDIIEAGVDCARRYGAGSTGSRLLSGNLACFEALEAQIAQYKDSPAAIVYSSGYQANSTALSVLLDKTLWQAEPLLFTDRLNHASLHHACQLAGVRQIRFRHNDLSHLAELLEQHAQADRPIVIVTETVFGMEGDSLNIEALAELACRYNALVYLDEAHATGVWGPQGRGLGVSTHPAVTALKRAGHWVVMGTFSKAVGVSGAYIACSEALKSLLINKSSGFVYSTAPSPFVVGAVSRALELIPGLEAERTRLHQLASGLRRILQDKGFSTGESNTHIVPIITGSSASALMLKARLAEAGLLTSAVRPPTVPPNTARVRLALCAHHREEDTARLSAVLDNCELIP